MVAFILSLLSSICLIGCVGLKQRITNGYQFHDVWSSVIGDLNQERDDSNLLNVDLLKINKDEMASIEALWLQQTSAETNKNVFFHEHITRANERAFLGLDNLNYP